MKFLRNLLASILGFFIAIFILFLLMVGVVGAVATVTEETVKVEDNSILLLRFDGPIKDRIVESPFGEFESLISEQETYGLNVILKGIKKAKNDDNIKGMYINCDDIPGGIATTTEIRNAILDFKSSGKFIYSYNDNVSQKGYYLSSLADSVVLNPQGMLDFRGLSTTQVFFTKAMEKLGVEMQIVRGPNNDYKSAVEPFTKTKMSDSNKEQTKAFLSGIWNVMLQDISSSRNLSVDRLQELANEVMTLKPTSYIQEVGLVDNLKYKDQVIDDLKMLSGTDSDDELNLISINDMAKAPSVSKEKKIIRDKIAVIYGEGAIAEGSNAGIKGKEFSHAIRKARKDDKIKAIVLRVNSPGGSAFSSEVIWREVALAKEVKPVIVSMGDVAASGGYYISCASDHIMASPTTITGSIGIYAQIPNFNGLMTDKIGLSFDGVETNDFSEFLSVYRPLTSFERNALEKSITRGYETFIGRVAEGRGKTTEEINEVGRGRVWAGVDAKKNDLVDSFGGLQDAIALAAEKAEIDKYRIVDLPEVKDPFVEMLEKLTSQSQAQFLQNSLGEEYRLYQQIKSISSEKGIFTRLPYSYDIN